MLRLRASLFGLLALASLAFATGSSRADESDEGLPSGPRIGLIPGAGGGIAAMTSPVSHYPSFIGLTTSQIEIVADLPRIGFFLRGAFHSSGEGGRWTAPAVAAGAGYRFFGDGDHTWSLIGRAGLLYERWHASTGGCSVYPFFPNSCVDITPPPPPGTKVANPIIIYRDTVDTLGLLGGVRLEAPVQSFYLAFGAELSATGDVSQPSPGSVWQLGLTVSFSFRSHQTGDAPPKRIEPARYRERN